MAACPSCHSPIEPADRFCSTCGASLASLCTTCGSAIRPGSDACASCGTPLASGPPTVEHRLVTAMYVDLVGSTGLAESLDSENLAAVAGAVHALVRQEVTERGGSIGAFVGDGVLGMFGLPTSHEDDPARALRAASAILRRVADLDLTLGRRFDITIAVRIGVNTGELLVPVGADPDVGMLAGDVLNVAARLQELAHAGTILAAERTTRSAPSFRFEDLGLRDVRGRARPIHTFAVLGEVEFAATTVRAPLHGRNDEQRKLQDLYRRVGAEGRPHLVTVIGSAGVGKSRLVREFVDWAQQSDQSLTTLSGRCLPYGEDVTYRPLADVLADLTGVTSGSETAKAAPAIAALVERYLEAEDVATAVDALLRMIGLQPLSGEAAPAPRRVRELLRSVWVGLLAGLAADGPVLLQFEDIHWAGDALLDLIEHVVRRAEGPLLVVCPARHELLDRRPDWGEQAGAASVIELEPLDDEQAERLAVHLLATAGLPISDAARITERAGGNPFFIEELARQMGLRRIDSDHESQDDELPATIQGVLSARIDLLGPTERHVLQAASVVGRIFWPSAVASVTGYSEQDLGAALDRLEGLQFIRVNLRSTQSDETEYIFRHVLIREAAYARLSRRDLARLHAAVANWLERRGGDRPDAAERLAYHTWRAHDTAAATADITEAEIDHLRELAVQRLIDAATRARERAAFGRSRELAGIALALTSGPQEAAMVHRELGLTSLAEYDGDAAWESLRTAVDLQLAAPVPDPMAIASTAAIAVDTPLRWWSGMRQLPPMADVMRYVDIGIAHAGSADSEALAQLLTALAFAPTTPGPQGAAAREVISVDEGVNAALRSREMAQRLGLPHVESAALDALQAHALWSGRVQEAADIIDERLELVDRISDPWEVGDTYAMAAALAYDFGRYALARDRALHGYRRTIDEAPSGALHNLSWATQARVQLGEWNEVAAALSQAHDLLDPERRNRPPQVAARLYAAAAMVSEFRGRREEADRLLKILEEVWHSSDWATRGGHPHARWTRHTGPIYIRRGDFETAAELVRSDDAQPLGRESDRLSVLCDLVAAQGDWDTSDDVIEQTRAAASAYGLTILVPHAERLEGRASIAAGDHTGGLTLLTTARERFGAHGDRWEAARTGLYVSEAGGEVDLGSLTEFFAGLGAIDELGRTTALITA